MENQESSFWDIFHSAWGNDRGNGKRCLDYDKAAWAYVQAKIEAYVEQDKLQPSAQRARNKYRVMSSRFDIQEHLVGAFEAEDDNEANRIFDRDFRYNQNYGWDWLRLLRIDQEEKTTQIAYKV